MILNFKSKLFYGGGDLALNLMWQLQVFYIMFFYTDVFGLSPATAGLVFGIAKIWDAFSDPIMGYIADNTVTKWGKFRPYVLFGSIPALISIILCFMSPELSQTGKFYWALFTYISFTTLYTVVAIPLGSMIPVMTEDLNERTSLASYRYFGASLGAIVVVGCTRPIAEQFSSLQIGFPIAVSILAFFGFILFFLFFLHTDEKYTKFNKKRVSIKDTVKLIINNVPLHFIIVAFMGTWIANNMKQITTVYFIRDNLQLGDYEAILLFAVIIQIMFGAFLANVIKKRFEKKEIFIIGSALYVVTDLIIYFFTGYDNFWLFAFFAFFGFIGFGMTGVAAWSMLADTVQFGEWKSGFRAEGAINSVYVLVFKIGLSIAVVTQGIILERANYIPNAQNQSLEAMQGLFKMGFLYPSIAGFIAILVMYYFKYDNNFYKKVFADLSQKKDL
tara:strand:+ start:261 stop:1595 length:1335 start_codon:yes stop_codon:yes gene_type:complete